MIDLHTHTTCSDGTDSPFALVKKTTFSKKLFAPACDLKDGTGL